MEAMTIALIYFSFFAVPLMLVTAVEYIICKFFPHLELWIERKIIGEPHGNAKK
ncbi:MAG: hypothetical protein IJB65_05715 [Clostridia bacterium]|nr:hypothetical protein [Clostridia bacterium]